MRSNFNCQQPLCNAILIEKGYCEKHKKAGESELTPSQLYDQSLRDARSKQFYSTAAWKRARLAHLKDFPVCEVCSNAFAVVVHHVKPLAAVRDTEPELMTAQENLQSCCWPCHSAIEMKRRGERRAS